MRALGAVATVLGVLVVLAAAAGCGGDTDALNEVRPLAPDSLRSWMIQGRQMLILDTRPDSAYAAGHIPSAAPAGGHTLPELRDLLPLDHHEPIVFYNQDGTAPATGVDLAREASEHFGFPLVYRLEGGLDGWVAEGHPVDGLRAPHGR